MEFFIVSEANPKLVLDVEKSSKEENAKVIIYTYTGNNNQKWRYEKSMIINVNSGKALDIGGGGKRNSLIIQHTPQSNPNQIFYIYADKTIRSEEGLCLDITGQQADARSEVIARDPNGSITQQWRICTKFL